MYLNYLLIVYSVMKITSITSNTPCNLRKYDRGYVCVCNSTYCDVLDDYMPGQNQIVSVSSSDGGLRFNVFRGNTSEVLKIPNCVHDGCDGEAVEQSHVILDTPVGIINVSMPKAAAVVVDVDPAKKDQNIDGFGGAYTGSVIYIVEGLSKRMRETFYNMYYSRESGIGYNFIRTPLGGSDFDYEYWAYNEYPLHDVKLTNFTQLHEKEVPRVKQIKEMINVTQNHDIKLMANTWSAPNWIKSNNGEMKGGYFKRFLRLEYYQTWADYHIKYLELMEKVGLPFWGVGTVNEPNGGFYTTAIQWWPYNYAVWLTDYFCPTIRSSRFNKTKIFILDDSLVFMLAYVEEMERASPKFIDQIDGVALHWYSNNRMLRNPQPEIREKFKGKMLYMTESSICRIDDREHIGMPRLGDWHRGITYADVMIQHFALGTEAWIDWNLILDEKGGPKGDNFRCDAAIIANTTTNEELYKQPIYYVIGHFSKFLIKGTVKIASRTTTSTIDVIAFLRPDNLVVVVIQNPFFVSGPVDVTIRIKGRRRVYMKISSYSIHSVLFWIPKK